MSRSSPEAFNADGFQHNISNLSGAVSPALSAPYAPVQANAADSVGLPERERVDLYKKIAANQFGEAIAKAAGLQAIYPKSVELLNIIGTAHIALGEHGAAAMAFHTALKHEPANSNAHHNLGQVYQQQGEWHKAKLCFENALKHNANFLQSYSSLAIICMELKDFRKAEASLRKLLKKRPDAYQAYYNLANLYLTQHKTREAMTAFNKAIALKPDYVPAYNNLGAIYETRGEAEKARECYEKALSFNPDYVSTLSNLGNYHTTTGDKQAAIDYYEKALAIDPGFVNAYKNYCLIKKFTGTEAHLDNMLALLENPDINHYDRTLLSFSVAKAYADIDAHDQSFNYYRQANALKNDTLDFSLDAERQRLAQIKSLFGVAGDKNEKTIKRLDVTPSSKFKTPVFILGMPRSGTTLVEQILSTHTDIHGAGELTNLIRFAAEHELETSPTLGKLQKLRKMYLSEISKLGNHGPDHQPFVIDKMPLNFWHIGFIKAAMPEAKIIHTKRDAVATGWSIYKMLFSANGNDFGYDLDHIAGYYRLYSELMTFWNSLYPDSIYNLNYETLTEAPQAEVRRMLEFIGVPWQDKVMNFHENNRSVRTASASQVRRQVYQGSSEEWKKFDRHLAGFADQLAGL